jgi:uncharacterized protein (DUF433 family)
MIDWSHRSTRESDPEKMSGAWVFRGTRVPASLAFNNLKDMSIDELIESYPTVTRVQVEGLLDFVAKLAEPVFIGKPNPAIRVVHAHSSR